MKYFLYNKIPGVWEGWTLAVLATSQYDADGYMKNHHHGGKRCGVVASGPVKADCGAVTPAAEKQLAQKTLEESVEV